MVKTRRYDEVGREKIRKHLEECEIVVDLGCNDQRIREDAIGYDVDVGVEPDYVTDFNDPVFTFHFGIPNRFDGICISHLLEHIIDVRHHLKECYKALGSEGRIAIIVPDGEAVCSETLGDSSNTHEMLFTAKTLRLYLENAGFKEVYTEYYNRPTAYKQVRGIFACGIK